MKTVEIILPCLVLFASIARPAIAGDDLDALLSESIESTASKAPGTSASAPALTTSITAEDMRRYGIRTLAEAYNFLSVGLVSEDPLGEPELGSRGVMFTGDQGRHVLLLIDGHTMNDQENGASFHGRAAGIPIEIIDHIEIVLGPGSVLYGSNAMFGVINVVTKLAKDVSGVQLVAEVATSPPLDRAHNPSTLSLRSPYLESLGHEYRIGATAGGGLALGKTPAEFTAGIEYYTFAGPDMAWGPQYRPHDSFGPRSPFGSWGGRTTQSYYGGIPSGYARARVGEVEVAVHGLASRQSAPFVRRQYQSIDSVDFDDPDGYQDLRQAGIDLKWQHNFTRVISGLTRLYGDSTSQSSRQHDHSFFGCLSGQAYVPCQTETLGYSRWAGAEFQSTFDWMGNGSISSMVGVDARIRRVGYQNATDELDTGQRTVYGEFNRTEGTVAAYAQQVYKPIKALTFNAGARIDYDDRFGSRISPRGAIIVESWRGGTIKTIYAEAFRAPTADEQNFTHPLEALAARDLQPETVRSVEALLQQRFGAQSLMFGLYRSWWSNMILRRELNDYFGFAGDAGTQRIREAKRAGLLSPNAITVYQFQNVASTDTFGLNGGYAGSMADGRLTYALNLTASYARLHTPEGDRLVTVTPSIFGNARISYDLSRGLPVVGLAAHFSDQRLADAGEEAGFSRLPYAPPALDMRVTASGPVPSLRRLSYRLMGDYSFARSSPYTAGPLKSAYEGVVPELIPANRLTLMLGLRYDL